VNYNSSGYSVFKKTFDQYLKQTANIDVEIIKQKLGVSVKGSEIDIPFFNRICRVNKNSVTDPSGSIPSFEICIILLKYLLTNRSGYSTSEEWVAYRDLRDSRPLLDYFKNEVEKKIASHFKGNIVQLEKAGKSLGGYTPKESYPYDVAIMLRVLPRIPVLLLFNDADPEFDATCSVLFERRAENYLDAECLSMVGRLLFELLIKAE
jgi:hypothetical protein